MEVEMDNYFLWIPIVLGIIGVFFLILGSIMYKKVAAGDAAAELCFAVAGVIAILVGLCVNMNGNGKPIAMTDTPLLSRLVVGETYTVVNKTEYGHERVYYLLAGSDPKDGLRFYESMHVIPPKFIVQKDLSLKEVQ